jgi:hypothetical protein
VAVTPSIVLHLNCGDDRRTIAATRADCTVPALSASAARFRGVFGGVTLSRGEVGMHA